MNYEVYFTLLAQERLDYLVDYLEYSWGTATKDKFLLEVIHCIDLISKGPELFPLYEDYPNVRRCVISTHNCLFYRVVNNQVQILTIWDNCMNPESLKRIISQSH